MISKTVFRKLEPPQREHEKRMEQKKGGGRTNKVSLETCLSRIVEGPLCPKFIKHIKFASRYNLRVPITNGPFQQLPTRFEQLLYRTLLVLDSMNPHSLPIREAMYITFSNQ